MPDGPVAQSLGEHSRGGIRHARGGDNIAAGNGKHNIDDGHSDITLSVEDSSAVDAGMPWWSNSALRDEGRLPLPSLSGSGITATSARLADEMNVVESSDARRVSLTGEATGTPVLFPKMDAELVIARVGDDLTQVKIEGQYAPPLGGFGRLIDQAFLHRVAEATSKELVDRIVEELDAE